MSLNNAAVNSISSKRQNEEYDGPFKPAKVLKQGSVLDILKSPGFASSTTYSSSATPPVTTITVIYTRPAISSFSTAASGFGEISKPTSSYWQCEACLVKNKATDSKCIACQTAKVSTSDGTKHSGTLNVAIKPAVSTTGTQGFGDKFKAAAGTWDCDTCLVQNKPEATKCVACETTKPGTGVKPALVMPVVTENTTTVSSSSRYTDTTVTLGFGDKFKKPKGSWECSVCLVSNKAEDSKCVACQSDKPGGSVPVVSSSASCLPSLSGGFLGLDKFKKPEGSWDCETCLVQNKAGATKCVACESAKPGSKVEEKSLSAATPAAASSAPSAPLFKFGIQSSSSDSAQTPGSTGKDFKFGEPAGFKFGIASDLGGSANTLTGGFKASKTEGSKSGSFPAETKSEGDSTGSKSSSSFNFGLPSGATSASSTGFQFGIANLGQPEKKEGLSKPAVGSFSFGTASAASSENKTGISGFKFGNAEGKEGAATPFSFKSLEEKKDEIPTAKSGFAFGTVESATAPQLALGRTDDKQDAAAPSNPLVFGKKAENEEAKAQPIFPFGKVEQTKDDSTGKPAFSFSLAKPAEKETEQILRQRKSLWFPHFGAYNPNPGGVKRVSLSTSLLLGSVVPTRLQERGTKQLRLTVLLTLASVLQPPPPPPPRQRPQVPPLRLCLVQGLQHLPLVQHFVLVRHQHLVKTKAPASPLFQALDPFRHQHHHHHYFLPALSLGHQLLGLYQVLPSRQSLDNNLPNNLVLALVQLLVLVLCFSLEAVLPISTLQAIAQEYLPLGHPLADQYSPQGLQDFHSPSLQHLAWAQVTGKMFSRHLDLRYLIGR
uniref:Uncharacterized protein n=1 Tax=Sphaerodactylus townsendi TaxID=933632 RepID=A0ACB8FC46_9SAUR